MITQLNIHAPGETESAARDIDNNSDFRNNVLVICETISDPVTPLWPFAEIWDCGYTMSFNTGNNNTKQWL